MRWEWVGSAEFAQESMPWSWDVGEMGWFRTKFSLLIIVFVMLHVLGMHMIVLCAHSFVQNQSTNSSVVKVTVNHGEI